MKVPSADTTLSCCHWIDLNTVALLGHKIGTILIKDMETWNTVSIISTGTLPIIAMDGITINGMTKLVVILTGGIIRVIDNAIITKTLFTDKPIEEGCTLRISPDAKYIAVSDADSGVIVFDTEREEILQYFPGVDAIHTSIEFTSSPITIIIHRGGIEVETWQAMDDYGSALLPHIEQFENDQAKSEDNRSVQDDDDNDDDDDDDDNYYHYEDQGLNSGFYAATDAIMLDKFRSGAKNEQISSIRERFRRPSAYAKRSHYSEILIYKHYDDEINDDIDFEITHYTHYIGRIDYANTNGSLQKSFLYSTFIQGNILVITEDNDILIASNTGNIIVLSMDASVIRLNLNEHRGLINSLHYNNDQKILISGGDDGSVRLWSLNQEVSYGKRLKVIEIKMNCKLADITGVAGLDAISPNKDKTLEQWLTDRGAINNNNNDDIPF
jgi:hypothetical protein